MSQPDYDIFIIGGGINGCGIARDAAGRGYKIGLAEMNDLASGTSSWSTKLIHGGLRYLETYEFRLVREALIEREVLCSIAPHLVRPMRFILPHHPGLRPAWLIRLGLFLYDHLGGRKRLPPTKFLSLQNSRYGKPLKSSFKKGFEYSDCAVDDTRLVILNALSAQDKGADLHGRTKVVRARRIDGFWQITLRDRASFKDRIVTARLLVNAAGPWVDRVLTTNIGENASNNIRMVKGSHIVVRKFYAHDRAYIFQNADKRIIFAIPYEGDFTLIGTTDLDYEGDPANAKITDREIAYLCTAASAYFNNPIKKEDIVWTYSGVRPLYQDGAAEARAASRDYVLKSPPHEPPLINIFGGKLTTYRPLAESVLTLIEERIGAKGPAWTDREPLPGGDFPVDAFHHKVAKILNDYAFISEKTALRWVRAYGTKTEDFLKNIRTKEDLGLCFCPGSDDGLYAVEVDYLMDREWAETAEDILWRRSKLGIHLSDEARAALDDYMKERGND